VLSIRPRSLKTLLDRVSILAFVLLAGSVLAGALVVRDTFRSLEESLAERVAVWVRSTFAERSRDARSTAEGRAYSEAAIALALRPTEAEARRRFDVEHVAVVERRDYSLLVIYDRSGREVFRWTRAGVAPPPSTLTPALIQRMDDSASFGGYLRWGSGIYRLGGAQLRASRGAVPLGYAVVGAPADTAYLTRLLSSIALPMRMSLEPPQSPTPARRLAGDSMVIFVPLQDVLGAPLATVRAPVDRQAEQRRFTLGLVLLALVLAGGALTSWTVWFYGRRLLLDPLAQTVRDVEAMRDSRQVQELSLDLPIEEWEVLRAAFNDTVRALEEFQRRYRDVFDQNPDPLFLIARDTLQVIDANPATAMLTGMPASEMLGRVLPAALLPGSARQQVVRWRRPDGASLTWSVSLRDIALPGAAWTLASYRDLTGREALAHTQKMEAVGLLAGGIAHDFNNLLGAVLTGITAARALTAAGHPAHAALDGIEHAGTRAAELTRQLLSFSRHDPLRVAPVEIGRAAETVRAICARTFHRQIAIEVKADADVPPVLGDAGEIEQALLNLCINARDAMPSGGTLEIAVRRRVIGVGEMSEAGVLTAGTYVELVVSDTGTGMTEDVKSRIFEPFFTTKEPGKGTGLGLPIAYGLVRQLGGAISVQSQLGEGTRVQLLLPALAERDRRPVTPPRPFLAATDFSRDATRRRPAANGDRPTVLLVDDETTLREMLRIVLDLSGYTVVEAADGSQALDLYEAHRARVCVVLLDVQLPGTVSGVETLERLRARDAALPVLLCTGFVREDEMARLRMLGVHDVLLKPLDLRALIDQLDAICHPAGAAGAASQA
jgi:signal transduction histidine kinase/ActR/RegA family two-component response regulator